MRFKNTLIFSFALLFCGIFSVYATWPAVPEGASPAGWLGEVFNLNASNNTQLVVDSKVGIGTTTPKAKLEVDGLIKTIPRSDADCSLDNAGSIYYDKEDYILYVCAQTKWMALSTTPDFCADVVCDSYCDENTRYYDGVCVDESYGSCNYTADVCSIGCSNGLCLSNAEQVEFTTAGEHTWTVPEGVYSVSVVCIGGGGGGSNGNASGGGGGALAYANNITTTPGETMQITVGAGGKGQGKETYYSAKDPKYENPTTPQKGETSQIVYSGSYLVRAEGGTGGGAGGTVLVGKGGAGGAAAGGAGGYSGAGGEGKNYYGAGEDGTGGAGGGGGGGTEYNSTAGSVLLAGGQGGGVGIWGEGNSGKGGAYPELDEQYGEDGGDGSDGHYGYGGKNGNLLFSSNAAIVYIAYSGGDGGDGACRIIWPGDERKFPSTKTADE